MKRMCILHINDGSLKLVPYPVYLELLFYHWHFIVFDWFCHYNNCNTF
jgi:hypothetical protein